MQKLRMSVLQKIFALLAYFIDVLLKKFKGKKNNSKSYFLSSFLQVLYK